MGRDGHGEHGPGWDVVIVGAGVAGSGVLVSLVRALARTGPGRVRSIRLVDPRPPGWGVAFGDPDPLLLCNSAAEVNSLLADEPADFVHFLRDRGWTGRPQDCVPRARMAEYCATRSAEARRAAAAYGVEVDHVRATVEAIETSAGTAATGTGTGTGARPMVLRLSTGDRLTADAVVVCTGVHRPRVPDGFTGLTGHPGYVPSPYPADRLRRSVGPSTGRVLVLGTRQSAIDASLVLCGAGHEVTMTSPSGLLPAVRVSLGAPERDLPPLHGIARLDPADPLLAEKVRRGVVEAIRLLDDRPLRAQRSVAADPVRRLREETALVDAGACAWPGVVVPTLEAVIALTAGLPGPRRRELLERFSSFIGRYATAMTVVNAHRLLALFDSGALRVAPAYPSTVSFTGDAWRVRWTGAAGPESFDHVVNATGFRQPELSWSPDGTTIHLTEPPGHGGTGTDTIDALEADLRVRRGPGAPPERVWIVGVGTHVRIPFSNHLRNVARQARQVAAEVSGCAPGAPSP